MQISDAEWIVMNLVWRSRRVDARQVIDRLADANSWSAATVKTMLHRLVKKGALQHEPDGKRYVYHAKVRRGDCVRQASRSFVDRVFDGQTAPALLHFVKTSKLTTDEVAQLRALLDDKDQRNDWN